MLHTTYSRKLRQNKYISITASQSSPLFHSTNVWLGSQEERAIKGNNVFSPVFHTSTVLHFLQCQNHFQSTTAPLSELLGSKYVFWLSCSQSRFPLAVYFKRVNLSWKKLTSGSNKLGKKGSLVIQLSKQSLDLESWVF